MAHRIHSRLRLAACILLSAAGIALTPFSAYAVNDFSIGVEGFRDSYKEYGIDGDLGVDPHVDTHTDFGSITGTYMHESAGFFSAIDGRYSQGDADYKSLSGVADNIPDKEGEVRLRTGAAMVIWHGKLMPYIGLGARLYYDKFKDAGPGGYDRHITQFYVPIGASWQFTSGSWNYTPMIELDPVFWGQVNSHLSTADPTLPNISNTQHHGIGVRSEFMVGQQYQYVGWQVGPFVRYWHMEESDADDGYVEPKNARLQYGGAFRLNF